MKSLIKLLLFFLSINAYSQFVISNENIDNSTQYVNGILVLEGSLGFLPPVMTAQQRDKIPVDTSSEGLIIYSQTSKSLNIYDGANWHIIKPQYKSVRLPKKAFPKEGVAVQK